MLEGDPENHHRLGQGVEQVGDQQPPVTVDLHAHAQGVGQQAVASQQEDQPQPQHQRRCQDRQGGDSGDITLARHAGTFQAVGNYKGQHQGAQGGGNPQQQAVEGGPPDARCIEQVQVILQANSPAPVVQQAVPQDADHRQAEEKYQCGQWQPQTDAGEPAIGR